MPGPLKAQPKTPEPALPLEGPWIEVGRIGRPHGIRGEVRLTVHNPASQLWKPGVVVRAWHTGKPARALTLTEGRPIKDCWIARFAGVDDRNDAELLTNWIVQVAESMLPPADDDEVYLHELVGADVIEAETGAVVGTVQGFVETAQTLMEVRLLAGGSALIPLEADAVESLGREIGKVVVRHVEDWKS